MLMFSTLAVTGAPRNGLPASSVTTPVTLPSETAATVPLGITANHNAKPKLATPNSATQMFRVCLVIEILLSVPFNRPDCLRLGALNNYFLFSSRSKSSDSFSVPQKILRNLNSKADGPPEPGVGLMSEL